MRLFAQSRAWFNGLNHNVQWGLIWTALNAAASGVWSWVVLSMYLFELEDQSNSRVGFAEGIQGALKAAIALPAGWAADRYRRDTILRGSAFVSVVAICVTVFSLLYHRDRYLSMVIACALWGVFNGASAPALEAIFADSVSTGKRSEFYSVKYILTVAPYWGVGPVICIFIFWQLGNAWTLDTMRTIMLSGMVLSIFPTMCLFFFNDDRSLGQESEGLLAKEQGGAATLPLRDAAAHSGTDDTEDSTAAAEQARSRQRGLKLCCTARSGQVPFILVASDMIIGLASGMTIKFFPIWFAQEVGMGPIATTAIYPISTVFLSLFTAMVQRLSRRVGRVNASMLSRGTGISLLVCMALLRRWWSNVWLMCALYVLRNALNNAPYPLLKSVLMDYVSKGSRGKVNSLESISQFGWSGSAIVGGVLLDRDGFQAVFFVTAAMQFISWAMLFSLRGVVVDEEHASACARKPNSDVVQTRPTVQSMLPDDKNTGDDDSRNNNDDDQCDDNEHSLLVAPG